MNIEESRQALFRLNYDYMKLPKEERLLIRDRYVNKRRQIQESLKEYLGKKTL